MDCLLNLQSQFRHDGLGDFEEVHLSQIGVSDFEGGQTQRVFSCPFILLHEPALLERKEDSIGRASIEFELTGKLTDLEMGFLS